MGDGRVRFQVRVSRGTRPEPPGRGVGTPGRMRLGLRRLPPPTRGLTCRNSASRSCCPLRWPPSWPAAAPTTTRPATTPTVDRGRRIARGLHARQPGDARVRRADGGDRQPGIPALLRGRRPDQRRGLRERRRLRDRRQARLRRGRRRPGSSSLQLLLRPRAEELRLRRQPDLDHAEARRGRSTSRAVLRGQAGRGRAEGLRRRLRDLAGRPGRREHRRPDRDHQPRGRRVARSHPRATRRSSTPRTTSSRRSRTSRSTSSSSTSRPPSS